VPAPPAPPAFGPHFDDDHFNFESFHFEMEKFNVDMDQFQHDMQFFNESLTDSLKDTFAMQITKGPAARFAGPADGLYDSAHSLINAGRYEQAINQLDRLIRQYDGKPDAVANRVDAALYWKAYAQMKESAFPDALGTLADLQKRFGDSRWLRDARALEVEVRQASGQRVSPDGQSDEDLKLLALRGLMRADPDRALPMIEQLMMGNSSIRVKENALFVLSQSRSPQAREIIASAARGSSNPDVQLRAVRYLGAMRTPESRQVLDDVYRSSSDAAIKRSIIQSYVNSEALDRLSDIVRNEKDVQLRRTAIRSLGAMRRANTGDPLRAAYLADSNADLRREVVSALAAQQNAIVLVDLARQEKDAELKRAIVERLGTMKTKEATDYLIELLK
jgi:HEAT repeat protein